MYVDAVEQWPGDFADVALDHGRRTHALARLVIKISARTRIHSRGEHEAGGEGKAHSGAGDGDDAVFEWLAEDFENVAGELGEFVQEEQTVVGEGDFAGARDHATADEARVRDGVVGRAEGTVSDQALFGVEHAGDGMDLGGFEGFIETQ